MLELREQADHVDRFLNKKSMWNEKYYQDFLKEIADTQQTVAHFYSDMVPYLDQLGARLPSEKEQKLLQGLGVLSLPVGQGEDVLDAEFVEVSE
jgi:hypothetical protein